VGHFDERAGLVEAKNAGEKIAKRKEVDAALLKALQHGEKFTKPYDKVLAIRSALKRAGFAIVRMKGKGAQEDTMGQFDKLAGLTEQEQDQDDGRNPLHEMMGMMPRRYINKRDLQYALEDAATTCERMWAEKKRWKDPGLSKMEPKHKALVSSLRAAAKAAESCADAADKQRGKNLY